MAVGYCFSRVFTVPQLTRSTYRASRCALSVIAGRRVSARWKSSSAAWKCHLALSGSFQKSAAALPSWPWATPRRMKTHGKSGSEWRIASQVFSLTAARSGRSERRWQTALRYWAQKWSGCLARICSKQTRASANRLAPVAFHASLEGVHRVPVGGQRIPQSLRPGWQVVRLGLHLGEEPEQRVAVGGDIFPLVPLEMRCLQHRLRPLIRVDLVQGQARPGRVGSLF